MTPFKRYEAALDACEDARNAAEAALAALVEHELGKLAKRFPTRRIEFHSGMGSSSLWIMKRHPNKGWARLGRENAFTVGSVYHHEQDWPQFVPIPCLPLWKAFETYENTLGDGKDPGVGSIIYENGEKLKGLG